MIGPPQLSHLGRLCPRFSDALAHLRAAPHLREHVSVSQTRLVTNGLPQMAQLRLSFLHAAHMRLPVPPRYSASHWMHRLGNFRLGMSQF